jgi:ankyrin repeat protein
MTFEIQSTTASLNLSILYEELKPLQMAPRNDQGTKPFKLNHFGWTNEFMRIIQLEKDIQCHHLDEDTSYKVGKAFQSFMGSMVKYGFQVNKKLEGEGCTPLYQAVAENRIIIAHHLISLGAKINKYGYFDQTPLYRAALGGYTAMVKLLIDYGASVNQRNLIHLQHYEMALHVAASPEIIDLLINNGTPVNTTSDGPFQFTALHWTAYCARPDAVEALIKHEAIDVKNQYNETALDIARKVQGNIYSIMLIGTEFWKNINEAEKKRMVEKTVTLLEEHHKKHHLPY